MTLDSLFSIAIAFTIVTVAPGPANISTAVIAMRSGRRAGLLFGLGLSIGLGFWGILAATGMGALLQNSAQVLSILKFLGGAYLIWLAFQSGKAAFQGPAEKNSDDKHGNWFWRGLLLNLSNPKAVIAWMAALSVGLDSTSQTSFVITSTAMCIAIGFLNYFAYATLFSLKNVMSSYHKASRWIEGVTAGLLAMAGIGLLRSAFSRH